MLENQLKIKKLMKKAKSSFVLVITQDQSHLINSKFIATHFFPSSVYNFFHVGARLSFLN